ncbi:MAG: TetR/AcrR family transcriptional regulator [Myxococcota bacterium]
MSVAVAERRRLSPEERREELLQFGHEFFAEHAFDAFSMDEIADMAGVSRGLLYHYFGGRRGFYLATVAHAADGTIAAMERARGNGDTIDVLAVLDGFVGYVHDNAGIYKAVIHGGFASDEVADVETDRVRDYIFNLALGYACIEHPSDLERIALRGWIAFIEMATAEWVDQQAVTRTEFVELMASNLLSIFRQLHIDVS